MRMVKKMRITKRVKKTRNADNKQQTNKQLRKEIFLSSSCHIVGSFTYIQNVMPIADTVLYPVIPFINVTEIRTLGSSSLNAHILTCWCTSPLSVQLKTYRQGKQLQKSASKGLLILYWPRLIFFSLPCNHWSECRILPDQHPKAV